MADISPQVITALSELWKPLGVLAIVFALVLFRQPLRELLRRVSRFSIKRGATELALEQEVTKQEQAPPPVGTEALPSGSNSEEGIPTDEETDHLSLMMKQLHERQFEAAEQTLERALAAMDDPSEKRIIQVFYHALRFQAGDEASLERLEDLATKEEFRENAELWLGLSHNYVNQFEKAAGHFAKAAAVAATDDARGKYLRLQSVALFNAGQRAGAFALLGSALATNPSAKERLPLYGGLAELFEKENRPDLQAIALEKVLEISPLAEDTRFQAAYTYSTTSLSSLSLLHYSRLLRTNPRHGTALNNLGVAYDALGMPIKAATSFRKAIDGGNTLASANVAYRFFQAGFAEEAEKVLKGAREKEECHPNVGAAVSDLAKAREQEEARKTELQETNRAVQVFLVDFIDAYVIPAASPVLHGDWMIEDGTRVSVEAENNKANIEWETATTKYRLTAQFVNRGATVRLITLDNIWRGLFQGTWSEAGSGYGWIDERFQRLVTMLLEKGAPKFYSFVREE